MKILLIGSTGFFGSRFMEFHKDKYDIVGIGSRELDVTNERKVMDMVSRVDPDIVMNAAAITVTKKCQEQPQLSHDVNVVGNVNVAKACRETGARMLFFSTEQVYNGNQEQGPYSELVVPVPATNYGMQKLQGEKLVREILQDELWILRFSWLFGLPERSGKLSGNILWNILSALVKGEKVKLPDNEFRGMTYIYDLLDQFPKVFQLSYGTYNIGSENNSSTYELGRNILVKLGLQHRIDEILVKDTDKYPSGMKDLRMDTSKLAQHGVALPSTEQGIERCLKEFGYM